MLTSDVYQCIINYCDRGSTYKKYILVCREWKQIAERLFPTADIDFCNQLLTLMKIYPNADWNWYNISQNPNITWEIIQAHPTYPWDFDSAAFNENISIDIIENNPQHPWGIIGKLIKYTWPQLIDNKKLWELTLIDDLDAMYWISQNPNITWEIICAHPEYKWVGEGLVENPNITWQNIVDNLSGKDVINFDGWHFPFLSMHKNITWDIIEANPEYDWAPVYVSRNPNITTSIIKSNPDYGWEFSGIGGNDNITWADTQTGFLHLRGWISVNMNITYKIILDNPNYEWNYELVSRNPSITWKDIVNNPSLPWDFGRISDNYFQKYAGIANRIDK